MSQGQWRFNRAFCRPQALSFDLDDTLYDNSQILQNAEQAQQQVLRQYLSDKEITNKHFWRTRRQLMLAQQPSLQHDIGALRLATLESGLGALGLPHNRCSSAAEQAFAAFISARQQISIATEVKALLTRLSQHYPLVALSNGNADVDKMGLSAQFSASFHAGPDGRKKPWPDLFRAACEHLNLAPAQICHIGDHPDSDIVGAHRAGMRSIWIHAFLADSRYRGQSLADAEIDHVLALEQLL